MPCRLVHSKQNKTWVHWHRGPGKHFRYFICVSSLFRIVIFLHYSLPVSTWMAHQESLCEKSILFWLRLPVISLDCQILVNGDPVILQQAHPRLAVQLSWLQRSLNLKQGGVAVRRRPLVPLLWNGDDASQAEKVYTWLRFPASMCGRTLLGLCYSLRTAWRWAAKTWGEG